MLFSSFVGHFSRTLYSLSVLGKRASRAASSSQDWDHEKGTCLDSFQWLPSVTFYLKVIYSVMPLLLRIWNVFWPFEDCYLLGSGFAQFFFYCPKLPCMKIYKHAFLQIKCPCFPRDLGPLHPSHQLQSPGLRRPWQWGRVYVWPVYILCSNFNAHQKKKKSAPLKKAWKVRTQNYLTNWHYQISS